MKRAKFKPLADDNLADAEMISVNDRKENIVGKGENAGYQHFLLCSKMFLKGFFPIFIGSLKFGTFY